jgi:CelD/BcsL family acetyltransferase involved in cellulose biosynthesis
MGKSLAVTRIQDIQSFEALRSDWTNILSRSHTRDIFLTWEWMFAWWKNIGQHKNRLWLLLIQDGEKPVGILPLMLNSKKKSFIKFKRLENIGNPDCDVSGIISPEPRAAAKAAVKYLEEHAGEWDILEINEMPYTSPETDGLVSSIKQGGYGLRETTEEHFHIPFEQTWEHYYKSLSKNLKHNFKRRLKRAKEMGNVKIERYSGNGLQWEHFQTIFKINEKSNFPDLYRSEENQSFHKDLFMLMQEQNWIQIEILSIDEKPIAFHYGFLYDGKYEDWRGGIDKDYEFIAPGKLLMMLSLEERFKTGFRENDFLRGKHSYKTDWLPLTRDFISIQAFNNRNIKSRLAYIWTKRKKTNQTELSEQRDE